MGRNGRFQKAYGKVIGEDTHDNRPGWKGPGYQKPKEKAKPRQPVKPKDEEPERSPSVPLELQQLLLNVFRDVFSDVLADDGLKATLQEVKGALYDRDFERAFGKKEFLEAYAARWSPSRALCYQSILVDIYEYLIDLLPGLGDEQQDDSSVPPSMNGCQAACFGGGAAEAIAFGGFVRHLLDSISSTPASPTLSSPSTEPNSEADDIPQTLQNASLAPQQQLISLQLLDIAHWDDVVKSLHQGLLTPPTLSKYASAASKAANVSLLGPEPLSTSFQSLDVLDLSIEEVKARFGQTPILLTLLFTLNELYSTSLSKTTAFLLNLTLAVQKGTLLLVVDSPGSYSETKVGNSADAKKYPMKWLMDHALLDSHQKRKPNDREDEDQKGKRNAKDDAIVWEKVVEDDSRWFRIPEGLKYAIPLENMRYQIHLYRRL